MNRNERRRVYKLTGQEIKEIEYKSMLKGVKGTMKIFIRVMNREFGYGDVRLKRIEDAVKNELGMEVIEWLEIYSLELI